MKNDSEGTILRLSNVSVEITGQNGSIITPVRHVSFSVKEASITAIVGESGSGKTLTAHTILGLLPQGSIRATKDSHIIYNEKNLLDLSENAMSRVRGKEIAMVFQDPSSHLNPVLPIGRQIAEPLMQHLGMSKRQSWNRAEELLNEVRIVHPAQCAKAYPHELSGGQQQRAMIAMAIACEPKLLIADEPTSALDVTVQRQIIDLMLEIQRMRGHSMIIISHDLAVVAEIADHVVVMRRGEVVEQGSRDKVLFAPQYPYTRALVSARVRLGKPPPVNLVKRASINTGGAKADILGTKAAKYAKLEIRSLHKIYWRRLGFWRRQSFAAVRDVSFTLNKGETLGVVGESGSGKTTLAMMLVRLVGSSSGSVFLDGQEILGLPVNIFRPIRRRIQVVFQNPFASLNPRWKIRKTLIEPMKLYGLGIDDSSREARAILLLEKVGLSPHALDKYPHEFSGGERQRIAIARCLTVEPEILICDECVSALDVSIQIQVLDLLRELQNDSGMSYLFISHDLNVIRYVADRVLVFQDGAIVESADTKTLFADPHHPFTKQLFAAIPQVAGWG